MVGLIDTGSSGSLKCAPAEARCGMEIVQETTPLYGLGSKHVPTTRSISHCRAKINIDGVEARNIPVIIAPDDAQSFDTLVGRTFTELPYGTYAKITPKEGEVEAEKLDVHDHPPQEAEKTDEIKANEETAAPKFSDAVAEPENKANESESAEEQSRDPPGDSEMSGTTESATQEKAPAAVEPQERVTKVTKDKAVASEEGIVKADEATAVKEEVAQPELRDEAPPERVDDEVPDSGDNECEEGTTKVDAAQKETQEPSGPMRAGADETTEQASKDQGGEEAASATKAEPEAADESEKSLEAAEEGVRLAADTESEEMTEEATDRAAAFEPEPTPPAEAVKKKTDLPKSLSKRATGRGPPRTLEQEKDDDTSGE
ncbi:hypothetical protein HPB49_010196 [Dermacentor silvarum]|uniref:Uncharacterized protein n=1 Tax=Dermacentor silvarum TaxID=543639 RepID=A0ACB8DZB3_DERSI|nr:hypothetical protein HPB49_010196 [Dermacentor silvarum]